jgi:hypothetical protein
VSAGYQTKSMVFKKGLKGAAVVVRL